MADMVANDTNRLIRITATFPASLDVTGATAQIIWRTTTVGGKPGAKVTKSLTNLSPSSGSTLTLSGDYTFAAGELKPGIMTVEMAVTIGGLVVRSDSLLEYEVRAEL